MIEHFRRSLPYEEISGLFSPYLPQLQNSFQTAIDELQEQSKKTGVEGNSRQVFVALLRTGVLLKEPWFQLDLKNDQGWGDLSECHVDWMPLAFLNTYEAITDKVGSRYQEEAEIELEQDSLLMAEALLEYLQKEKSHFSELMISKNLGWTLHIGEYMGNYS